MSATAEPLQADREAAEAEAADCRLEGPPNAFYRTPCNRVRAYWSAQLADVRTCARPGCGHHVHRWARVDAIYCSGTCRMAKLRASRRAAHDDADAGLKRRARKGGQL